ncbi:MAG: FAD-dependent oxidoreductase [Clostridiales bacterium]|jgi:2,4-dienoyl-CoA reductase-like NADH-dependent reductase (Old Yellow Enzyme family)/thioredoxin reductase|nr:FAD-dependent oxidoreductase [Clostridiales bacterium]
MEPRYKRLSSPLRIGGFTLKNRIGAGNCLPHFLQGPEPYPADPAIAHFENKARGAAYVTCMGINNFTQGKQFPMDLDFAHFPDYNLYDCSCQNYLLHLSDTIHFYNSLASMSMFVGPPSAYPLMRPKGGNAYIAPEGIGYDPKLPFGKAALDEFDIELIDAHKLPGEYDEETLDKIAESYAEQAAILHMLDFDMVSLHFAYRANLPAKFISPITNLRTDKFGGSLENRMRFPLSVLSRLRKRLGNSILIEMIWSAEDTEGGYTLEESAEFLSEASKYIDIVQLRSPNVDPAHPTGFTLEETPFLHYAEFMKKHVKNLKIATIGGYQDLDVCEKVIADGKADLIAMSRAFLSNTNLWRLMAEGRNDDVAPCLRCNKCHGGAKGEPLHSICSINPVIGLEHKIDRLVVPTKGGRKVAVIGGGPAGLRCAMDLADRGHFVDLYESGEKLGGAIKHSDNVDFKWPLKRYKDFLVKQVQKRDKINAILGTKAVPESISEKGYDVVVAAVGATPIVPDISGLAETQFAFAEQAFEDESSLGHHVVVIGGGEVGVECGIYLAKKGHEATVIEARGELAENSAKIHYRSMFEAAWKAEPNFHSIVNAKVLQVNPGEVICLVGGEESKIKADSVVISVGLSSKIDEALSFSACAPEFRFIGDCKKASSITNATRTAFAAAMTI